LPCLGHGTIFIGVVGKRGTNVTLCNTTPGTVVVTLATTASASFASKLAQPAPVPSSPGLSQSQAHYQQPMYSAVANPPPHPPSSTNSSHSSSHHDHKKVVLATSTTTTTATTPTPMVVVAGSSVPNTPTPPSPAVVPVALSSPNVTVTTTSLVSSTTTTTTNATNTQQQNGPSGQNISGRLRFFVAALCCTYGIILCSYK